MQPNEPNVVLSGIGRMCKNADVTTHRKWTQSILKFTSTSAAENLDSSESPTGLALISTAKSAGRRSYRSCHFQFWNMFEAGNVRHDAGMHLQ